MKKFKNWLVGLLAAALTLPAFAQFAPGQVLTAAQLNSAFANVLPLAGGTLMGPLTVPTLTVTTALNTAHANITGGTISGLSTPLPQASGGTGTTAATGTGAVVYAGSPSIANLTVTSGFTAPGLVGLTALAAQAANTVLANATGSSAAPAAFSMPSCSSSSSALQWAAGTGFACNTAVLASNVSGTVAIANGGTGATTQPAALTALLGSSIVPIANGGTNSATALGATANIQFQQSGTGAALRSVQSKLSDDCNALDFTGVDATGATDSTTGINNALAACTRVRLPTGTFKISGPLTLTKNGHRLIGNGVGATTITNSSASAVSINNNASLSNLEVAGFTLTRSVTATSGGTGIDFQNICSLSSIHDVVTQNNYNGLQLGPTDLSTMYNVVSQKNTNYGVYQFNPSSSGQLQWYPTNVLVQENGGNGWLVQSFAGPTAIALGTYRDIYTFANGGRGMIFLGSSSVPINGVRIVGGFLGQDANSEIYLDTYGDQHVVQGTFLELAGTSATGPTLGTPASNVGAGIEITGNNTTVQVIGTHANGNSYDGYYSSATATMFTGVRATNNGLAGTSGRQAGVNNAAGRAIVTGSLLSNVGASTTQKYGVSAADGNNVSLTGNDLTNNATGAWTATANLTSVASIGNLPNSLNVNLSPTGAVIAGSGATGGFANGAGTINVSGGLLKNNTAYTNP